MSSWRSKRVHSLLAQLLLLIDRSIDNRAALTAAAVDRLVETKGLDAIDKAKAKHHAKYVLLCLPTPVSLTDLLW